MKIICHGYGRLTEGTSLKNGKTDAVPGPPRACGRAAWAALGDTRSSCPTVRNSVQPTVVAEGKADLQSARQALADHFESRLLQAVAGVTEDMPVKNRRLVRSRYAEYM